jgi:hypothetical protein
MGTRIERMLNFSGTAGSGFAVRRTRTGLRARVRFGKDFFFMTHLPV